MEVLVDLSGELLLLPDLSLFTTANLNLQIAAYMHSDEYKLFKQFRVV